MILTVVSSEQNMNNLAKYQEISAKLADPRGLSEKEAQKLIKDGKAIYWICANIHAPEVGSAEMVMELAYKLATGNDQRTKNILDNVIVVVDPSINPDGHDSFTAVSYTHLDVYKRQVLPARSRNDLHGEAPSRNWQG